MANPANYQQQVRVLSGQLLGKVSKLGLFRRKLQVSYPGETQGKSRPFKPIAYLFRKSAGRAPGCGKGRSCWICLFQEMGQG